MSDRPKSIHHIDAVLIVYLNKQWKTLVKELRDSRENEKSQREILFGLANILREYINTVRPRRGGMISREFRVPAFAKLTFLQKTVLSRKYDSCTSKALKAVSYAKKYVGNIVIEGRALHRPVSAVDKKRLELLSRKASERFRKSAGESDDQDTGRIDVLRSLGVVDDPSELDEGASDGDLDNEYNGDSVGLS